MCATRAGVMEPTIIPGVYNLTIGPVSQNDEGIWVVDVKYDTTLDEAEARRRVDEYVGVMIARMVCVDEESPEAMQLEADRVFGRWDPKTLN